MESVVREESVGGRPHSAGDRPMVGRLLVTYDIASHHTANVVENLTSFLRYSEWDVHYAHVTRGAELGFDLDDFDAVLQTYSVRLPINGFVSSCYLAALRKFRGVKLLSVQDEIDRTNRLREAIKDLGFHFVLTCVPAQELEKIYPRELFPETVFIPVLPTYVPDHLVARGRVARPLHDRPIHIGYRGNEIGSRYGRLGFNKFEIGRRMREICAERGIPHDIEWSAEKRIYGSAWYDFLASCRTTLASEGSSNVYDFDGSIEETYNRLADERGRPLSYDEFRLYTEPVERRYDTAQIPPRVFEAAALRTPMILFSGRYSGLIQPEEHYIELKEDFSNIDAVLARLDDLEGLGQLADRAFEQLIAPGDWSYRRFVASIDEMLSRKARELSLPLRAPYPDRGEVELWTDPMALTSMREPPTRLPRHFVFFQYKQLAAAYTKEVARLNEVYPAEIARLQEVYSTEIARYQEAYSAEIARLQDELDHVLRLVLQKLWRRARRLARNPFIGLLSVSKSLTRLLNAPANNPETLAYRLSKRRRLDP